MNTTTQTIAIENNYLCLPKVAILNAQNNLAEIATIVSNINYFGFMPSREIFDILLTWSKEDLVSFWETLEPTLKSLTKEDRSMSDFMVYKNFPTEVWSMSEAEYWINQLFIYFGMPYESLQGSEESRPELIENVSYKVLQLAPESVFSDIFNSLVARATKWTERQSEVAQYLYSEFKLPLDLSSFSFKENGSVLSKFAYENSLSVSAKNATDVLRMAMAWSDISFESSVKDAKFKTFKRSQRRFILNLLEKSNTLENDISLKRKLWKKLFARLNPSDYKMPRCQSAYDGLYNKKTKGFESDYKKLLAEKSVLAIYEAQKKSVGFYIRNIHLLYKTFGAIAFDGLVPMLEKATISQLVKLEKYLLSENEKQVRIIAPKGNWAKAQLLENNKVKFQEDDLNKFIPDLSKMLNEKLSKLYPNGIILSKETENIKLPTNDLSLDFYGRGTSIDFPKNLNTVRVASYWESGQQSNIWFDNGVGLMDHEGKVKSFCTWNDSGRKEGAIFSGDPLPSKDKKGRACQVIDLDLEKLKDAGVHYVLWSITSYNNLPFDQAKEVLATLQFCEDAEAGKIFEPSRCQMSFDIKDKKLSKYVAYLDLRKKKVIFLDSNLPMFTHSITSNRHWINEQFSAMREYAAHQPSVYDLFKHLENKIVIDEGDHCRVDAKKPFIGYTDERVVFDANPDTKQLAYLFKHTKENNKYEEIKILDILSKS